MNGRIILTTALSLLITSFNLTAGARDNRESPKAIEAPAGYYGSDSLINETSYDVTAKKYVGTADLQNKILIKINNGLISGSISPAAAADLNEQMNKLNESESHYRSLGLPVPAALTQQDTQLLGKLNSQIESKLTSVRSTVSVDSIHSEIGSMISAALAKNKINNKQAADYYAQLAHLESQLESLKDEPGHESDMTALRQDLTNLKHQIGH